ncbi:MAG: 5'/3'-nucleotidase SurE [Anaerolineales bacterium]
MHILLTNDDGVHAPGLLALKQAFESFAKITVVAPSRNQSASGHRKTLHKPLRLEPVQLTDGSPAWSCSGAPSDCVALALLGFVKEKVDWVVSGINPHYNLGQDITYSGTVTAALEAVQFEVPGIAVSTDHVQTPDEYVSPAQLAAQVVQRLAERPLPGNTALNINVPKEGAKGWRLTRQGRRVYRDVLVERLDPRGKPYYWIGGEWPTGIADEGTDIWALEQGYASLTPLDLDLTAHSILAQLRHLE